MFFKKYFHKRRQENNVLEALNDVARSGDIVYVDALRPRGFFSVGQTSEPNGNLKMQYTQLDTASLGDATFIVCSALNPEPLPDEGREFVSIFRSPLVEILERKSRVSAKEAMPLRWGLNDEEKKIALSVARHALELFLKEKSFPDTRYFSKLPLRFQLVTDLDVSLWVRGSLRGSIILARKRLGEGIAEAARAAARDSRFKPVAREEFNETTIEIFLISEIKVPLQKTEREKNSIYPHCGYLLTYEDHAGWFLPGVFNCTRFTDLKHFLRVLAWEKAHIRTPHELVEKKSHVVMFSVDDFVESFSSEDASRPLSLRGPMPCVSFSDYKRERDFLEARLRAAADWICRIQEPDGNIPPIVNPLNGTFTQQIDWARLAFTALALQKFGMTQESGTRYCETARKAEEYLEKYFIQEHFKPISLTTKALTYSYIAQLSHARGNVSNVVRVAEKVLKAIPALPFDPLLHAHMLGFLNLISDNSLYSGDIESMRGSVTQTLKEYIARGMKEEQGLVEHTPDLASFAEAVNVFFVKDPAFSKEVADWLAEKQLPNGAFPQSPKNNFTYTRGTSKVFEVLALYKTEYEKEINNALRWLFEMQYTKESSFFIDPAFHPKVLGGIRHDDLNQEAWIDSAGHTLLGAARLLSKKN